jgi:hypothetical protein
VSTLAGQESSGFQNGPATTAQFNAPSGIGIDSFGQIYVADTGNNRIRLLTP